MAVYCEGHPEAATPFSQSLLRAVECLENNDKVLIELSATGGLYELFEIVIPDGGEPVGTIKKFNKKKEVVEYPIILNPSIVSFFFL